jgi:hypothetical protein
VEISALPELICGIKGVIAASHKRLMISYW